MVSGELDCPSLVLCEEAVGSATDAERSQRQNQELFGLLVPSKTRDGALRDVLPADLFILFFVLTSFFVVNFGLLERQILMFFLVEKPELPKIRIG